VRVAQHINVRTARYGKYSIPLKEPLDARQLLLEFRQ
jgi:hypothetical protein